MSKKFLPLILTVSFVLTCLFFLSTNLISSLDSLFSRDQSLLLQKTSLLNGRLDLNISLSRAPNDFVLHEGKIYNSWGLGVPLMYVIFSLFGSELPDRLILFFCVWVFSSLVFLSCFYFCKQKKVIFKIIFATTSLFFCLFFLPVFSLARTHFSTYELVVFVGYIFSLGSFFLLLLFDKTKKNFIFLLFVFSVSFLPFIRPTLVFYSLAGVCIFWFAYGKVFKRKMFVLVLIFLVSMIALLYSNFVRYGNVFDFGHFVNIGPDPVNNYQLKYDYGYKSSGLFSAGKEMVGSLIGGTFNFTGLETKGPYAENIVFFQNNDLRWRAFYSLGVGVTYLAISFLGVCFYIRTWRRSIFIQWILLSFSGLFIFYLKSPSMSSRYIVDFAPVFCVAVFYTIASLFKGKPVYSALIFVFLTLVSINKEYDFRPVFIDSTVNKLYKTDHSSANILVPYEYYVGGIDPKKINKYNGAGWDYLSGAIDVSTVLIVKEKSFLLLSYGIECTDFFEKNNFLPIILKDNQRYYSTWYKKTEEKILFFFSLTEKPDDIPVALFIVHTPVSQIENKTSCRLLEVRGY